MPVEGTKTPSCQLLWRFSPFSAIQSSLLWGTAEGPARKPCAVLQVLSLSLTCRPPAPPFVLQMMKDPRQRTGDSSSWDPGVSLL